MQNQSFQHQYPTLCFLPTKTHACLFEFLTIYICLQKRPEIPFVYWSWRRQLNEFLCLHKSDHFWLIADKLWAFSVGILRGFEIDSIEGNFCIVDNVDFSYVKIEGLF